jgi:hypothetical protein
LLGDLTGPRHQRGVEDAGLPGQVGRHLTHQRDLLLAESDRQLLATLDQLDGLLDDRISQECRRALPKFLIFSAATFLYAVAVAAESYSFALRPMTSPRLRMGSKSLAFRLKTTFDHPAGPAGVVVV